MKVALALVLAFSFLQDVPFKDESEFSIDIDYQLKKRPADKNTMQLTYNQQYNYNRSSDGEAIPFLGLSITVKKANPDEVKLKVFNNDSFTMHNKKIVEGAKIKFELGYIEDIKSGKEANEFFVHFLNPKKKVVSRIHMIIQEDGTFLVNNEVRGKF